MKYLRVLIRPWWHLPIAFALLVLIGLAVADFWWPEPKWLRVSLSIFSFVLSVSVFVVLYRITGLERPGRRPASKRSEQS